METIPGHDEWKTADPTDPQRELEIDWMEANLPPCRLCHIKPSFEVEFADMWHVRCYECGVDMPGDSAENVFEKWGLLVDKLPLLRNGPQAYVMGS